MVTPELFSAPPTFLATEPPVSSRSERAAVDLAATVTSGPLTFFAFSTIVAGEPAPVTSTVSAVTASGPRLSA